MIGVYRPYVLCGTRSFCVRAQSHLFYDWQHSAASIGFQHGQRVGMHLVDALIDAALCRLNCIKRKRHRPMTDPDSSFDSEYPLPDSITITIPIGELRRLLAELNSERAVTACPAIVALILDVALLAMPPLVRLGVRGWIDGLAKRRRQ